MGSTIWRVFVTGVPEAFIIRMLGLLALAANVVSVLILMRFRSGDANLEYVWLCSRNDPIGNVAVVLAAIGVFTTGAAWPDLAVAAIMASLFLSSYYEIVKPLRKNDRTLEIDNPSHGENKFSPAICSARHRGLQ